MAMVMMLTFQTTLFVMWPTASLKAAYIGSWRKTGAVIAYVLQVRRGPEQLVGFAAFGLIAFYVATAAGLDITAHLPQ